MKSLGIFLIMTLLLMGCERSQVQKRDLTHIDQQRTFKEKQSIVFITGFDEGENTYYANAAAYFKAKKMKIIHYEYSLQEILLWLNKYADGKEYDEIHIVGHSNAWRGMSLKTTPSGERITVETLETALKSHEIPQLNSGITASTKIVFHSCGLGENQELLRALKAVFTITESPQIHASPYFNVFGGKFAAHYLAKPYYGYYPTGESPGPLAMSKSFKTKYSTREIDWFSAVKTRTEEQLGVPYSYKFNIPVDWEFEFDEVSSMPFLEDREAIMDWVASNDGMATTLFQMGIPLEKFRWKSKTKGKTLIIKGKTTVLCVLEPILDTKDANEYRLPKIDDTALYQIL